MNGAYASLIDGLEAKPRRWLVTGAAGFIGSHLVEALLCHGQRVVGLDDFSTGKRENLEDIQKQVGIQAWERFSFVEGDICDFETAARACQGVDCVLHQAALGSVPRSIADPLRTNRANVDGFLCMLTAAKEQGVKRVVYASSSSVYGDNPALPKREDEIGRPLSPYAASKRVNEIYAQVFSDLYGMETLGLRYFNVFGPRQDPEGPYAAVIPKWINCLRNGEPCRLYGDGQTSRDFCFVDNVVQANILAACVVDPAAFNKVYNIAVGGELSLNELFQTLVKLFGGIGRDVVFDKVFYEDFRPGDVRHSRADITRAQSLLGFEPLCGALSGLEKTVNWFLGASTS